MDARIDEMVRGRQAKAVPDVFIPVVGEERPRRDPGLAISEFQDDLRPMRTKNARGTIEDVELPALNVDLYAGHLTAAEHRGQPVQEQIETFDLHLDALIRPCILNRAVPDVPGGLLLPGDVPPTGGATGRI